MARRAISKADIDSEKKRIRGWIFAMVLLPLFLYILIVGGGLSRLPTDWSSFGDFMVLFVSIANLFVFYKFTAMIYDYNVIRDEQLDAYQDEADQYRKSLDRPVIAFISNKDERKEKWKMENVGKGAAMNVKVGIHYFNPAGGPFKPPTLFKPYYALAGSSSPIEIADSDMANVIVVLYQDIRGVEYVSIGANRNTTTDERSSFKKMVITTHRLVDRGTTKDYEPIENIIDKEVIDTFFANSLA